MTSGKRLLDLANNLKCTRAMQAIGASYDTIDVDGATHGTCRLIDAKYDSGRGGYTSDLQFIAANEIEILKRYRYTIELYSQPVALEIRTNTGAAQTSFVQWAVQAGFILNQNVFVRLYS